jgi:hypothetical protein
MPFCGIDLGDSSNRPTRINPQEAKEAFDILRPKMSPLPLVRIGGSDDGAYLLPDDLAGISGCLSPGVNNFKPFEDELSTKYGIRSDLFDASSSEEQFSTPLIKGMQTFEPKWLSIIPDNNSITINQWLASKPPEERDFLLQMDIEGAEYKILRSTTDEDLSRFRILVIEFHSVFATFTRPSIFYQVMQPLLNKLNLQFVCVHVHPNNNLGTYVPPVLQYQIPALLEVTFLRRDRFLNGANMAHLPVSLPHPKDITNVYYKSPLHLDLAWSDGRRNMQSQLHILQECFKFFQCHHQQQNLGKLLTAMTKMSLKKMLY